MTKEKFFRNVTIIQTAFDAEGFLKVGVDAVLRGMAGIQIPNFHQYQYRDMDWDFSDPNIHEGFDLVAWTIQHERERGLPTFNQYFEYYSGKPQVKPRKTFEEFSNNATVVQILKELYDNPDAVDLTVGQYLDETYFPGTTVPRSQLITSLFSLFRLGIGDRFSPAYSMLKCFLVGTPWNCTPVNALEELLWVPCSKLGPKGRWMNIPWIEELNMKDYGDSSLWRIIHDNTNVKCVQRNPFFPADKKNNPIYCSLDQFNRPPLYITMLPTIVATVFAVVITVIAFKIRSIASLIF